MTIDEVTVASDVQFRLDGRNVRIRPKTGERLSESLRERLESRDVKIGCEAGDCGACTVLLDGEPVCSCLVAAHQVEGQQVETLAGLAVGDPHAIALVESFQNKGAAQCGICTPGMIVSATALLRRGSSPTEEEIEEALGGVLCRCTGYRKIIEAVRFSRVDESPAPDEMTDSIGQPIRRLDGCAKVRGTETFGDDIAEPDALTIRIIRSPHRRASFALGNLDDFLDRNPGIELVLTARDIPGLNRIGVIPGFIDQPVFAENETRFRGEAVAAVVGTAATMRRFDERTFPIAWTELPAVTGIREARAIGSHEIHAGRSGNLMCSGHVTCGDPERALDEAFFSVEGEFETSFVEHAYIEPEAGFARLRGGRIEIFAGTQAPVMDLEGLSEILAVDRTRIRVVPTAVGGGFGSKLDLSVQPYLALAALRTGRPVRLAYTRTESMQATTKRHPALMNMRIGATREGLISGMKFLGAFDTGAYASWGPTVANRVPVHASGPYFVTDYSARADAYHTHCTPSGAFRGFGVPQSAIAQEALFDELAELAGLDRLEFRRLNALRANEKTVCGQSFSKGVGIGQCFDALRDAWQDALSRSRAFNRDAADRGTSPRRGVGVAAGWYGCGNTSLPNPSTIKAGIRKDGTVVLHQGAVDIGQGSNTVIAQIFAEALGTAVESITLAGADTDMTPDAGKTSASRQTYVSGNAAKLCGEALRSDILRLANVSNAAMIRFAESGIAVADRGIGHEIDLARMEEDAEGYVLRAEATYDPPTRPLDANGQGEPYAQFGFAAQMTSVEVDTVLGTVRALEFVAAHDVGRAINPMLVEGQIHGGVAQGLGMALMEEFVPGQTENLHDYLIPTVGDIPAIRTIIVEDPDAHGPYGAKGLGEHALIPTAPAILNAIHDACGARIRRVPATPARVLAAIEATRNG